MSDGILASWRKNADEWVRVLAADRIPSRRHTNRAILEVIKAQAADNVLDCGCGEGWLTRAISDMGKTAVGTDAIDTLIEHAEKTGKGQYHQLSYETIMEGTLIPGNPFDLAVFNFSLCLEDGVIPLLKSIKKMLMENGKILVQTLHPFFLMQQGLDYRSQWISDSWKGLPGNFEDGHPWYARTFEDWHQVFADCGLRPKTVKEVSNEHGEPLSVLFVLTQ